VQGLHCYRAYVSYWLDAVDEHSLHSPFLFNLMTRVISVVPVYHAPLERLRQELMRDKNEIPFNDLGTGATLLPRSRSISTIAKRSLSPARFSCLYQRLISYFRCTTVVELGTSLGINTLYLAQSPGVQVYTFEGADSIAAVAQANFARMQMKNITLIQGDIDVTLADFVAKGLRVDFAFMDANHTLRATVKYFEYLMTVMHEESVLVVDDIHLTQEMESAWLAVQRHERVRATADLYRCGIAFFTPLLDKQHVVLKA